MSLFHLFGYGTLGRGVDVKVIRLSEEKTIDYICCQIVDLIHDCTGDFNVRNMMTMLALFLNWLADVNSLDRNLIAHIHATVLEKLGRFASQTTKTSTVVDEIWLRNIQSSTLPSRVPHFIVDRCVAQNKLLCNPPHSEYTFSTLFDNGTREQCPKSSEIRAKYNIDDTLREFGAINKQERALVDAILAYYDFAQLTFQLASRCTGALKVYDTAIIGSIRGRNIVLAYRGTHIEQIGAHSCVMFSLRWSASRILAFGQGQSSRNAAEIFSAWRKYLQVRIEPNDRDKYIAMRVYTNLVSKHWGDLGLITDTLQPGTSKIFMTEDKHASAICQCLGVPYLLDGNRYFIPPTTGVSVKHIKQCTGVFGRVDDLAK